MTISMTLTLALFTFTLNAPFFNSSFNLPSWIGAILIIFTLILLRNGWKRTFKKR